MKKIMLATALIAAFAAPQAFAQAKNFEGFSVAANLNMANNTTEVTSTIFNAKSTESAANLGLQGQYNFVFGNNFVLGLGLSLGLGELKAGTLTNNGATILVKLKEAASVYVAPGFAASDTTLVYGKIASLTGKFEAAGNAGTVTTTVNGVGYGIGLQNAINKNMFVQVEYMQNNYADRSFALNTEVDKNNSSVLSIGLGYKF